MATGYNGYMAQTLIDVGVEETELSNENTTLAYKTREILRKCCNSRKNIQSEWKSQ